MRSFSQFANFFNGLPTTFSCVWLLMLLNCTSWKDDRQRQERPSESAPLATHSYHTVGSYQALVIKNTRVNGDHEELSASEREVTVTPEGTFAAVKCTILPGQEVDVGETVKVYVCWRWRTDGSWEEKRFVVPLGDSLP